MPFFVSEKGDVKIFNVTSMDVLTDLKIGSMVVHFLNVGNMLGIFFFGIFPEYY